MVLLVSCASWFHGQAGPLDELELCLAPLVVVLVPSHVNTSVIPVKTAKNQ